MYAQVDGMRLSYEEHGRPDGPPLVLLHGFTVTGRITWDEHLDALAPSTGWWFPTCEGTDGRTIRPDPRR